MGVEAVAVALAAGAAVGLHLLWPQVAGRGAGYGGSDLRLVEEVLRKMELRGKVFYDLGCGYGSVLKLARAMGAVAVGVEIDPVRWLVCKLRCRCKVILGDMFKTPLKDADVVYVFQWPSVNAKLAEKLNRELKSDAVVVSYRWEVPDMELVHAENKVYVYRPKRR